MRKLIFWLVVVAFAAVWFLTLHPVEVGGKAGFVLVSGRSMEPTYYTGDLVITRKQSTYEAGDIVAYRVEEGQVIHRIVGGNGDDGYLIQGDNNPALDPWVVTDEVIVGREWIHVPGGAKYIEPLRGPEPLAAILVVLITMGTLLQRNSVAARPRSAAATVVMRI